MKNGTKPFSTEDALSKVSTAYVKMREVREKLKADHPKIAAEDIHPKASGRYRAFDPETVEHCLEEAEEAVTALLDMLIKK